MTKLKYLTIFATALSSTAFAQSSVTLYGVVEDGIGYISNEQGKSAVAMQSGYNSGSRWGLQGAEDLGGGAKAIFQLENGFDTNTGKLGSGGREFGRQAFVGLQSQSLGTVTFGRQYDLVQDYFSPLTLGGHYSGVTFAHPFDNDNANGTFHIDNAIKYASNSYHGFSFSGMYGFSNQSNFAENRYYGMGARYVTGPLTISAIYQQMNSPASTAGGAVPGPISDPSSEAGFGAARQRVWGGGVSYIVGDATFAVSYSHTDLLSPTASAFSGNFEVVPASLKFDNFEANTIYKVRPDVALSAMYTYTQAAFDGSSGKVTPKWHQVGVMADYSISQRTGVYVEAAYQKHLGDDTGVAALDHAYIPGAGTYSSSASQFVVRGAFRHTF